LSEFRYVLRRAGVREANVCFGSKADITVFNRIGPLSATSSHPAFGQLGNHPATRRYRTEPGPMAVWGLIVVGGLVIGSIPAFLGLIFVMPVLGHATWHLYRKVVP
jgi:hypothetical protein